MTPNKAWHLRPAADVGTRITVGVKAAWDPTRQRIEPAFLVDATVEIAHDIDPAVIAALKRTYNPPGSGDDYVPTRLRRHPDTLRRNPRVLHADLEELHLCLLDLETL
jgi:hypothetical protein